MLTALDITVIASYLAIVVTIGFISSRGQRTTRDYFLAGRTMPWWAAGLSIIATETSALTFIGAPTQSLRGDWTYFQLAIGSALARFAVAGILLGAYYRAEVYTVYGYLAQRFGPASRNAASLLFFVGRTLGSGVRLYGAAIALVVVADIDFPLAIGLIAAVAVAYTIAGGIRSVIWTDVLQGLVLIGGAGITLYYLGRDGDGIGAMLAQASAATMDGHSKLRMLNLSLDPQQAYTLLAGLIGSAFLTFSTHGTDQDMIQRALTCRNAQGGQRSMILSAFLALPIVIIFLTIGSLLWVHLGGDEGVRALATEIATQKGLASPDKGFDFLFPFYIVQTLPAGLRGLIIAAIFAAAMSSLDSAITALGATAVKCLWEPYVQPGRSEHHYLKVSRRMAVFFGALLSAVALVVWLSEGAGSAEQGFGVLMLGLKVLTWVFPPLLGVFLVGVLTQRGSDHGNLVALAMGIGLLLVVERWQALFGSPPPFAWTWNAFIGCGVTFALAAAFPGSNTSSSRN